MEKKEMEHEIASLRNRVRALSKEIESIRAVFSPDSFSPEHLLTIRGVEAFRKNPADRLFFPPRLAPSRKTRFYELMQKYSFRLTARDMIKKQGGFRVEDLVHYCGPRVVQAYCTQLSDMGIIVPVKKGLYRTAVDPLYSFGPTLEWFIAEMFQRAFASPAIYGVRLKRTPSGGDYDVIAAWNRRLVYVEVKSSPPKGIESSEISAFFSRTEDLLPEIALLFNDTHLRMKDKLVVLFEEELEKRFGTRARAIHPVERIVEELFHVNHRIFIVNSRKKVAENFRTCLMDYLRYGELARIPKPLLNPTPD